MNSRLELPAVGGTSEERKWRQHQRGIPSDARSASRPEPRRNRNSASGGAGGRSRPVSALVSGTVSPEEVFGREGATSVASKSMTALGEAGMNIGRVRNGKRKGSTSSTGSSSRTMQAGVNGS